MRIIILILSLTLISLTTQAKETATIQISAEGQISAQPDLATINLQVLSSNTEADSAMKLVDKQVSKLIKKLSHFEVKQDSLDTSQVSVQPEYDYKQKPRKLMAYQANRSITFQITKLTQLEKLLKEISQLELISINNVSFSLSNMQRYEDTALINAINTAKEKAQVISKALDVSISGIHKVMHQVNNPAPIFARAMSAEMRTNDENSYIQKKITVKTRVEIEFEIN